MNEPDKKVCEHCGSLYIPEKRGLHNWKRLFRKPSGSDWIVLIMLAFVILLVYVYMAETKTAREFVKNFDNICIQRYADISNISKSYHPYSSSIVNLSISLNNDRNATNNTGV